MTELLCVSKNNKRIYYNSVNSHASTHFADTVGLRELAIEVLVERNIDNNSLDFDIDMGRIIGTTDVVETDDSDDIVYALRIKRTDQGYVPFVKSRSAQPSTYISISLVANTNGTYQLSSAYIGALDDPPFPQEPNATAYSKPYWGTHAFVWGSQEIILGSEIKSCPW